MERSAAVVALAEFRTDFEKITKIGLDPIRVTARITAHPAGDTYILRTDKMTYQHRYIDFIFKFKLSITGDSAIYIIDWNACPKGNKIGGPMLSLLSDISIRHGVTLYLKSVPIGESNEDRHKFLSRLGFIKQKVDPWYELQPRVNSGDRRWKALLKRLLIVCRRIMAAF
ncbi:MAG: hypothetical protein HQL37_11065 [Alphaproteobacteria bacterium]|nr:hypothetical protein [Alphaproteobacteria bacterium]